MDRKVYPNRTTLKALKTRFYDNEDISDDNKKAVRDFIDKLEALGNGEVTIRTKLSKIKTILTLIYPGFDLVKAGEVELNELHKRIRESEYGTNTKCDFTKLIRKYYKVMEGRNSRYPEKVDYFNPLAQKTITKGPEDIISRGELNQLLGKCQNARDKAIVWMLFEGGLRVGELCSLDIRDVSLLEDGVDVNVPNKPQCKTGARPVPLVEAYKYVRDWVESHPLKGQPDAPFFVTLKDKNGGGHKDKLRLTGWTVRAMLHRHAEEAGLPKAKFHPHSFRHTACTEKAVLGFTKSQHDAYFGHHCGEVYIHLNGKQTRQIYMEALGFTVNNERRSKQCSKCGFVNTFLADCCGRCNTSLDAKMRMAQAGSLVKQVALVNAMLTLHPELGRDCEKICLTEKGKLQELMEEFINGTISRH